LSVGFSAEVNLGFQNACGFQNERRHRKTLSLEKEDVSRERESVGKQIFVSLFCCQFVRDFERLCGIVADRNYKSVDFGKIFKSPDFSGT